MKYKDTGFRALYNHFAAFMLKDSFNQCIEGFPNAENANCVLTYGYIDHEAGLTLEVLCAGIKENDSFRFFDYSKEKRAILRVGSVIDDDFYFFDDADGDLKERYLYKLDIIKDYEVSDEIEESRKLSFLDKLRHEHYPDDVMVYLVGKGLKPEGCWVRITGLGDHCIKGILLNEPDQDFCCHEGEQIEFYVQKTEDDEIICYCDVTPVRKLTADDLEDGSLLKESVVTFNSERTEEHFIDVLQLLRDSLVWVPCNAILSDSDMSDLENAVKQTDNDMSSLVGKTFHAQDNIRLVPDILQNGDKYFFPIFSSAEEMGEYGSHFSKIQKHMLEVIPLAINNGKNVSGIVLNAFTSPFVVDSELFDMIVEMESRLIEE